MVTCAFALGARRKESRILLEELEWNTYYIRELDGGRLCLLRKVRLPGGVHVHAAIP